MYVCGWRPGVGAMPAAVLIAAVVCLVWAALPLHGSSMFESVNDPRLTPKNLRHAARMARKLGTDKALQAFDEAAAGFDKPAHIIAATCVLPLSPRCCVFDRG